MTHGFGQRVEGRSAHLSTFAQPRERDIIIAEKALGETGVSHLRDKLCNQMSGGEPQMIFMSRALATEPGLMILDEP